MLRQENTQTKRDTVNFWKCVFEGVWGVKKMGALPSENPQVPRAGVEPAQT